MSRIAAVIVTFESSGVVKGLLASLDRHEPNADVIVVDNASPSGLPDVHGTIIRSQENRGYGAACNLGARALLSSETPPEYIAFLNPDVRLRARSLSQISDHLDTQPHVGVATGPLVDEAGRRVPSAWGPPSAVRMFWFASGLQLPTLRRMLGRVRSSGSMTSGASTAVDRLEVDGYVLGGAMVVRRECWLGLGGFDEGFFLFREDADLCERARQAGWEIWMLPCTPLVHLRGSSTAGVSDEQRRTWYLQGARRYAQKHGSPGAARRLELAFRLGSVLRRLRDLGRQTAI